MSHKSFNCGNCKKELSTQPDLAGTTVACPYCSHVFITPGKKSKRKTSRQSLPPAPVSADTSAPASTPALSQPDIPIDKVINACKVSPYVIYKPKRPALMSLFGYLGFLATLLLLLAALYIFTVGTETLPIQIPTLQLFQQYKLDLQSPDTTWIIPGICVGYLFLLIIVWMGMLKGVKFFRALFVLFFLGLIGMGGYHVVQNMRHHTDLIALIQTPIMIMIAAGAAYLFLTLLYLQTRRARNWFG